MTEKQSPATPKFKVGDVVYCGCIDPRATIFLNQKDIIKEVDLTGEKPRYKLLNFENGNLGALAEHQLFTKEEALKKFNQWMEEND